MGFFDSVIEQTIDLLKRDGELSSCRILKAHPDCFHQSPLSKVTVTAAPRWRAPLWGIFWEPGPPVIFMANPRK